jgi:hypothetical protein
MVRRYGLAMLAAAAACSSAPAPAPRPASRTRARPPAAKRAKVDSKQDGLRVEGTLGSLSDAAIQAGLGGRLQAIGDCHDARVRTEPYLGGKLVLHFRVARDGSVARMHIAENALGSLAVERCVTTAVAGVRFARPSGGEAEFSYPLAFQARVTPLEWSSGMVSDELGARVEQLLDDGKGGTLAAPAGLVLTIYVDVKGRVVSAGLAAEAAIEPAFADRFVANLKRLKLVAPSGGYARVSYTW